MMELHIRHSWIFSCYLLLLAVLLQPSMIAQDNSRKTDLPDPWLERAELLTDDLSKDASALTPSSRALLWVRLGELWWESDATRAHEWMRKAVEIVESHPDQEEVADCRLRLMTARALLPIVVQRDKDLGARLITLFTTTAEQLTEQERSENAKALADTALELLENEPKRAAEFASASFHAGQTYQLTSLLWKLSAYDPKLAEPLFNEAIAVARATYDTELLKALALGAYAGMENPSSRKQVLSDELCLKLLIVISEGILRPTATPAEEAAACRLTPIVALLLDEISRLFPKQSVMVRTAVTRCQPFLNPGHRREVADSIRDVPLTSVDDFIKVAGETDDAQIRGLYLMRAAHLAAQQKNFDQAITILDSVSTQTREHNLETWEGLRRDYAAEAALAHFSRKDIYMMRRIIDATPSNLRAFVYISIAEKMIADADRSAMEFLQEARNALTKATPPESLYQYIILTKLYAKFLPLDAPTAFSETVAAINRAERFKQSSAVGRENEIGWQPIDLPIVLLETDELGVRLSLSSIAPPIWRVALRIGLLKQVLVKQRSTRPAPKSAPRTSKDKRNVYK